MSFSKITCLIVVAAAWSIVPTARCQDGPARTAPPEPASFPPLDSDSAWGRMARATPALPIWARSTVDSLPRATASLLDLDFLHRTANPLGPELAARIRWVVADANRCAYAQESAAMDLEWREDDGERHAPIGAIDALPEPEKLVLQFARKLTLASSSITDKEVGDLIEAFSADDAVAIVHTIALANFQDRLYLGLGLTSEPGGPVPPRQVRPTADCKFTVPVRSSPVDATSFPDVQAKSLGAWNARTPDELRGLLDLQKSRLPRIPDPNKVRLARLPRPQRGRVGKVSWTRVSMGYQPELTDGWFQVMKAFNKEADLEEVFANSVFWVVTRTNDCFY